MTEAPQNQNSQPFFDQDNPDQAQFPIADVGQPTFPDIATNLEQQPAASSRFEILRKSRIGKAMVAIGVGATAIATLAYGISSSPEQASSAGQSELTIPELAPGDLTPETTHTPVATETSLPATTALPATTSVPERQPTTIPGNQSTENPEALSADETAAPELLSADEKFNIIQSTGMEGLANHDLEVAERFSTKTADIVVIVLDGAELSVPISELQEANTLAETLAEQRLTFEIPLTLGPGNNRTVAFEALPTHDQSPGRETRYFIFADSQPLDGLAAEGGVDVSAYPNAFTFRKPYLDMSVSFLRDQPGVVHHGGISANSHAVVVEALQAATFAQLTFPFENSLDEAHNAGTLDLSYVQNPNYPNPDYSDQKFIIADASMEGYANSLGLAARSAKTGKPHEEYRQLATNLPLGLYPDMNAQYFVVDSELYESFLAA